MLPDHETLLTLTTEIVSAHVGHNTVAVSDMPTLISRTFAALSDCGATITGSAETATDKPARAYAGSVKSSVKPDGIISMIDGKSYKMLRRHLATHGHTPESYRAAYDLPADYPMTAPGYSAARRDLALKSGLGRKKAA
jgi:predicted transcriptional regulator